MMVYDPKSIIHRYNRVARQWIRWTFFSSGDANIKPIKCEFLLLFNPKVYSFSSLFYNINKYPFIFCYCGWATSGEAGI